MSTLKLESSDGQIFCVPRAIAEMSETIKNMLADVVDDVEQSIPLSNISAETLTKILEWAEYHSLHPDPPRGKDEKILDKLSYYVINPWDKVFCDGLDQKMLFDLVLAANYLAMKPLLDLTCQTVATMIKGKTPDEIRATFNIENDFTPEEEENIRRENEWNMDL